MLVEERDETHMKNFRIKGIMEKGKTLRKIFSLLQFLPNPSPPLPYKAELESCEGESYECL